MDEFDIEWNIMAENGLCDGIYGAEYQRVKKEWNQYGKQYASLPLGMSIRGFIYWRANI